MAKKEKPVADAPTGMLRGEQEDGLAVFRGVPYAKPPVGDLRWRAAQPHPGWSGIREAAAYGPSAPQPYAPVPDRVLGRHGEPPFDEDCLTLNVWTPGLDDSRRPVLVWIHGGGFISGSGALPIYAGDTFARAGDLVVVTLNYRIGPLGYLYLTGDHAGTGEAGNLWLTDQLAALRWVRDNISAFGGDPGAVTVAGQSGGAFSAAALACHDEGRGLLRRIILQSPPFGLDLPGTAESRERTERFMRTAGVKEIAELRELPWPRLAEATVGMLIAGMRPGHWTVPFLPVLDQRTMSREPLAALRDGAADDVDVLLGWTADEASFAMGLNPAYAKLTRDDVVGRFRETFGDRAEEALATYAAARPGAAPVDLLIDLAGDNLFRVPALGLADARAARGRPVWAYQFDYRTPAHDGRLGATHCLDLPFTFHNAERWAEAPFLEGVDPHVLEDLGTAMHRAWISFVRTGDPNHDGLPRWPRSVLPGRPLMRFDTTIAVADDPVGPWRRLREHAS